MGAAHAKTADAMLKRGVDRNSNASSAAATLELGTRSKSRQCDVEADGMLMQL